MPFSKNWNKCCAVVVEKLIGTYIWYKGLMLHNTSGNDQIEMVI